MKTMYIDERSRTQIWNDMDAEADSWRTKHHHGFAQHRTWNGGELVLDKAPSGRRTWTLDGEKITGKLAWEIL